MPRPRYQLTEADVPVVHRWVQAKVRDTARAAWDRFPHEHPSVISLQQWCDQYLNATQWTQLQTVIRAARRDAGQTRTVRLSTHAHARLHDLAQRAQLTLSETIERYLADVTVTPTPANAPHTTEKALPKSNANRMSTLDTAPRAVVPRKQGTAFVTSKKGVCYLTITIGQRHFPIMRIRQYTIDAQDKREMRRLHPDIAFDWKKIACQLAEKREVCRQYRSRRRTRRPRLPREPFYGVLDPLARTVYVNDPTNFTGVGALLDHLMADERLRGTATVIDDRDGQVTPQNRLEADTVHRVSHAPHALD
jgi:macrodomain Ter protein organizer (MatP/YcbG family)